MEINFTTEKTEKGLRLSKRTGLALIVIGLIVFALSDHSNTGGFRFIGNLLDNVAMPSIGLFYSFQVIIN